MWLFAQQRCITYCPGRLRQCLFPAVLHEWHLTADCLVEKRTDYFISHQKTDLSLPITSHQLLQPSLYAPSLLQSTLRYSQSFFFKGYMIPEISGRSTGPKDKPISSKQAFNMKALLFIGLKYILCCSSAQHVSFLHEGAR